MTAFLVKLVNYYTPSSFETANSALGDAYHGQ